MSWRVRNWDDHFENNRTRELKRMDWVPMPNRMDGDGYTELLDHENGASHFAAWVAIVEIASRCDIRGTLMRKAGTPHDFASLSRLSRMPDQIFREALPRLIKIGWVEEITVSEFKEMHDGAEKPHEPALDTDGVPQVPDASRTRAGASVPFRSVPFQESKEVNFLTSNPIFQSWWTVWSEVRGTHHEFEAASVWDRLCISNAYPAIECTQSYLASLENPAKGYNPDKFLNEQARGAFKARWPVFVHRNGRESRTDRIANRDR